MAGAGEARETEKDRKGDQTVCGFERLLLRTYCVPGSVLGAEDSAVNKRYSPRGAYRLLGPTANKYVST